jgi:hypothetical protein
VQPLLGGRPNRRGFVFLQLKTEEDPRLALKQLAVTDPRPALAEPFEQRKVDLDACCLRISHAGIVATPPTDESPGHQRPQRRKASANCGNPATQRIGGGRWVIPPGNASLASLFAPSAAGLTRERSLVRAQPRPSVESPAIARDSEASKVNCSPGSGTSKSPPVPSRAQSEVVGCVMSRRSGGEMPVYTTRTLGASCL